MKNICIFAFYKTTNSCHGEIYVQDFAALETLFKRFYKPLRAYAFRFVNDKDLSEDIVQDVFL